MNRTYSSARARLAVGAAVGIVVGVSAAVAGTGREAPLLGWCTLGLVYCGWVWAAVWPMDAAATAAHAQSESPGRDLADVLLLAASLASLLAVGFVLFGAGEHHGAAKYVQTALAVGSVAVSWLLVHTVFTLRYARLYYSDPVGGVDFKEEEPPQYSDFAYLAFTIGMTFQVSDTDLQAKAVRRTALRHALISFPLGTVIIATSVNLVAGLAK
ncbi:MAG TPA: DUF1345 domain-containing protein [Actinospica sp.]|nr:DUF1345 domain-containing protein [Actinospica sp.]